MHETNHASGFRTTENQKNPFISRLKIAPKYSKRGDAISGNYR